MKVLLQYGGTIILLIVAIVLAVCFYTDALQDATVNKAVLISSFILTVLGIILNILGGKIADPIGGK